MIALQKWVGGRCARGASFAYRKCCDLLSASPGSDEPRERKRDKPIPASLQPMYHQDRAVEVPRGGRKFEIARTMARVLLPKGSNTVSFCVLQLHVYAPSWRCAPIPEAPGDLVRGSLARTIPCVACTRSAWQLLLTPVLTTHPATRPALPQGCSLATPAHNSQPSPSVHLLCQSRCMRSCHLPLPTQPAAATAPPLLLL